MGDISIGIAFIKGEARGGDQLCSSVGDTLGLAPIIEKISKERNEKITVCTVRPELFQNNPYVKNITNYLYPTINILPCRYVACNIVQYYASQVNVKLPRQTKPKIYLTPNEIEYGKSQLKEFNGFKKIAVSTETGVDGKCLRSDYVSPLFDKLRQQGYKLIGVGQSTRKQYNNYDKSFINRTTLRQVFSIINECDLLVGIDNGLFHCAAALDVPQVIFFRNNKSSNNKYCDTFFRESRIECQGDCLNHIAYCKGLMRCMDSFDLNEYYHLINKCLNAGKINIETLND